MLVLAIDQGTTNTKAIVVDRDGRIVARASVPVEISFPQPAWVEQDPLALWHSVETVVDRCITQIAPERPVAIGISNQRETVLGWERSSGRPIGPAIVWQCRRTAEFCHQLQAKGLEPFLRQLTGLTIDPLFSGSKARWLLRHIPDGLKRAADGELCVGTVDSWILWQLTRGTVHATDVSNAARTQLLNLSTARWDEGLMDLFEIPAVALPQIRSSSGSFGEAQADRIGGIPVASLIGDSHSALFGQRGFAPGSIKATFGTGSSLMTPVPELRISERGLSSTVAWGLKNVVYALEGNISVTGAAVQWFGDFLGTENPAEKVASLARQVTDSGGVYVVPAFVGLGAPHWDDAARGTISGITRGTGAAHVARAVIESIAFQVRDVFDAMQEEAGTTLQTLLADGGATRNDQLMQFQADILGCTVSRNSSPDVSALGAAYLAGLAIGIWKDLDDIAALPRTFDRFEPAMPESWRAQRYQGWQSALARTRSH
jgi:glycerol kinase